MTDHPADITGGPEPGERTVGPLRDYVGRKDRWTIERVRYEIALVWEIYMRGGALEWVLVST